MNEYYLYLSGEQKGPYTRAQLQNMWRNGMLTGADFYWQTGFGDWRQLAEIQHLLEERKISQPQLTPSQPARAPVSTKLIRSVIAICVLLGFFLALGFFHVVFYLDQNDAVSATVIPKQNFTYSYSFAGVDEILDAYNKLNFAEQANSNLNSLVRALEKKGMIHKKKKSMHEMLDALKEE